MRMKSGELSSEEARYSGEKHYDINIEFLNKFFCVIEKSSFYNDYLFSNNKYDIRNYGKREFMTNQYHKI